MNKKTTTLAIFLLVIGLAAVGAAAWMFFEERVNTTACRDFSQGKVTIKNTEFSVAVAQAPDQRQLGLSGCAYLPEESGMLFVFEEPRVASFWMKDMVISLDIIWIAGETIVGIEENVPAPAASTPTSELPQYHSPVPVTHVLEIPAGAAQQLGIKTGDTVEL